MSLFSVSYKLETGPPPTSVAEYADWCNRRFAELLANDPEEPEVQGFLEQHPWLVPGHSTPGTPSGHSPLHCALISQPKLLGQGWYVPDFMWIAVHSGAWFPTLIEIEKPSKKIFNRDGTTSANFNRARNQLNQWRSWFKDPSNQLQFRLEYGIPEHFLRRPMQLHMILIYGRRAEFEEEPTLISQRNTLLPGPDEVLISFDRLRPDTTMDDAITVEATGRSRYRAKRVPPVFTTGPGIAGRLLHVDGIEEAIDASLDITEERKTFLKRRVPYWKQWALRPDGRSYRLGDRE